MGKHGLWKTDIDALLYLFNSLDQPKNWQLNYEQ
jgi:hypothetical protein